MLMDLRRGEKTFGRLPGWWLIIATGFFSIGIGWSQFLSNCRDSLRWCLRGNFNYWMKEFFEYFFFPIVEKCWKGRVPWYEEEYIVTWVFFSFYFTLR